MGSVGERVITPMAVSEKDLCRTGYLRWLVPKQRFSKPAFKPHFVVSNGVFFVAGRHFNGYHIRFFKTSARKKEACSFDLRSVTALDAYRATGNEGLSLSLDEDTGIRTIVVSFAAIGRFEAEQWRELWCSAVAAPRITKGLLNLHKTGMYGGFLERFGEQVPCKSAGVRTAQGVMSARGV